MLANDMHACGARLHVCALWCGGCADETVCGVGMLQDVAAVMAIAIIPAFDKNEVAGDTKKVHHSGACACKHARAWKSLCFVH